MEIRDFFEHGRGQDWRELTKRYGSLAATLAVVGLVVLASLTMFYRVDASSEGVVLRFGEHVDTVSSGLHFKLPWPIEEVYEVPVRRIQSLEFGFVTKRPGRRTEFAQVTEAELTESEMLTGDLNLARVEWIVQYRIKDPYKYLFGIGGADYVPPRSLPSGQTHDPNPAVPDTIRNVSESVMRQLVGDRSVDAVLTFGRTEIAGLAEEEIQTMLDRLDAGVLIETVRLQSTEPPQQVQDAFQEVNRAKQVKERMVNEAEGERNRRVPAARGSKELAISEARGYQQRVVLEATGRVAAFQSRLTEFEKAEDITALRLYLEAMEVTLAQIEEKTIIDESVAQGLLPLLELGNGATRSAAREGPERPSPAAASRPGSLPTGRSTGRSTGPSD